MTAPRYAIGTDVVAISRVTRLLTAAGDRFLHRWFTPWEIAYCTARRHPSRHLAGRLAAKEAVAKALGKPWEGPLPWRQIEVTGDGAQPGISLHGWVLGLAPRTRFAVSIAHTDTVAMATVIAWSAADPTATDHASGAR